MINIKFYQQTFKIKQLLKQLKLTPDEAFHYFEDHRQSEPVVFNIETTNNCNQHCSFCPRTTMMTRPVGTMKQPLFEKIVDQLKPWSESDWSEWVSFVIKNYKVKPNEMSENHFFFYIVPKVITLHGFGEPLLDKYIFNRVEYLTQKEIPSYFSCNPNNITIEKGQKLMESGLSYLKFSSDNIQLFKKSESTIKRLILDRDIDGYNTVFVLDIVGDEKGYRELKKMFEPFDVYMYFKSQDNQWFKQSSVGQHSVHWLEPCQFPWSSMSIMWDGSVVPCGQDYNNELILGNANSEPLSEIWNGMKYYHFRKNHLMKKLQTKCTSQCDMKLVGD